MCLKLSIWLSALLDWIHSTQHLVRLNSHFPGVESIHVNMYPMYALSHFHLPHWSMWRWSRPEQTSTSCSGCKAQLLCCSSTTGVKWRTRPWIVLALHTVVNFTLVVLGYFSPPCYAIHIWKQKKKQFASLVTIVHWMLPSSLERSQTELCLVSWYLPFLVKTTWNANVKI